MDASALTDGILKPVMLTIVAAAIGVGGRDWVVRARSGTKRIVAEDDAQVSKLEDDRAEKVRWVIREAELLQKLEELSKKLAEAEKRLTVVSMLSAADPASPVMVTLDSGFLDLSKPLRPHPRRAPAPPADPFMATDPFAPPVQRAPPAPAEPDKPLRMLDLDEYGTPPRKKP